jgi:SAM-dependent methyltransferase
VEREDWDARYAAQDLVWGAEPNRFLAAEFGDVTPRGHALDLACGEGRNAIWLARLGWQVTAVDYSSVALDRARRLAAEQRVEVEWIEADVTTYVPAPGAFALAVIAYLHLPTTQRRLVLAQAAAALAAGGTLFLVGHARRNLTEGVGGPQRPEILWDADEIRDELVTLGLVVSRAHDVRRPVEAESGTKDAIDVLVRAQRR